MNLSALDLNLLLVLHTVLTEGSVARAARRLAVTSPAVSNALARLRVALGDPLTVRSGRGIVPTPRAAALAPVLARTFAALGEAVSGTDVDPVRTEREFTLAMADVGQVAQLPRIVERLATAMPRARLRVVSIDTLHAAGGLASTAVDVSIGAGERGPGVLAEPLHEEHIVLVARRAHPRVKARVAKRVLTSLRHVEVHVAPGKGNRALAAAYVAAGVTRDIAVTVPTFTAAAAIVSKTDLVASLPVSLVEVLGPRLGLRVVATPLRPVTTTIRLLWHDRTEHDPTLRAFRALIRSA